MSYFITTGNVKKSTKKYIKQNISESRINDIQMGAGKTKNVTIEISKKFLNLESDLYLQGAKEIIKAMDERGKDACKKAKKHLKKFLEARKDGSKPDEEEVQRAVIDAFVLYVCKSKYIKLSNKDLSKMSKKKQKGGAALTTPTKQMKTKQMKTKQMKNSAIVLLTKRNKNIRFIILQDSKTGEWMIPGGTINRGEEAFDGMKREFGEEVGQELPQLSGFEAYDFSKYSTRIYISHTTDTINFTKNNEVKDIHFVEISELEDESIFNRFKFKSYAKTTLRALTPYIIAYSKKI